MVGRLPLLHWCSVNFVNARYIFMYGNFADYLPMRDVGSGPLPILDYYTRTPVAVSEAQF